MALVKRLTKGAPLTFAEGDANLQYLEDLALNNTINTGSLLLTSSFNSFTSSYYTDSSSFNSRINAITSSTVNTGSLLQTSSFNTFTSSYYADSSSFNSRINAITSSTFNTGSLLLTSSFNSFTSSYYTDSSSFNSRINAITSSTINTGSFATTGSNTFIGNQTITGSLNVSNNITASKFIGDGSELFNLPSQTNWNTGKTYRVRNTEQFTFSDDYVLEDSYLLINGGTPNSIGEWTNVNPDNNDATITITGNNTFLIDGPNDNSGSGYVYIKRYFDTPTTMSIEYQWFNSDEPQEDWPIYQVNPIEPTGSINNTSRLQNNNNTQESGSWEINVPADNWLAIGIYSTDSCCGSGSLHLTLPYISNENIQYAPNKFFKKEGSIFIGGNLLLKDSIIENDGKLSVAGDVILMGNSQIIGTGIII